MKLSSNKQLHDYLISLSARFEKAGIKPLSDTLGSAARTAGIFPATEFLGEARIALMRVLTMDVNTLDDTERAALVDVLAQLDKALDER